MLTAISRYGARVIPDTLQIIGGAGARAASSSRARTSRRSKRRSPHGSAHARAVSASYGRMAFFYILRALDLPAGSEIIFPALTFWVVPEMARVAGLTPVFADVDPETFNVTAATHSSGRSRRGPRRSCRRISGGCRATWTRSVDIAAAHDLAVIEDCAHALGAHYRGRPVGTFGDAAFFSFQTLKPLNTYGGGMAVTRERASARAWQPSQRPNRRRGRARSRTGCGRDACMRHRDASAHLHVDAVSAAVHRQRLALEPRHVLLGAHPPARSVACRLPASGSATCRRPSRSGARIPRRVDRRARGSMPAT